MEDAATSDTVDELLQVLPGKGRLATAAPYLGLQPDSYIALMNESLRGGGPAGSLGQRLAEALENVVPARRVT